MNGEGARGELDLRAGAAGGQSDAARARVSRAGAGRVAAATAAGTAATAAAVLELAGLRVVVHFAELHSPLLQGGVERGGAAAHRPALPAQVHAAGAMEAAMKGTAANTTGVIPPAVEADRHGRGHVDAGEAAARRNVLAVRLVATRAERSRGARWCGPRARGGDGHSGGGSTDRRRRVVDGATAREAEGVRESNWVPAAVEPKTVGVQVQRRPGRGEADLAEGGGVGQRELRVRIGGAGRGDAEKLLGGAPGGPSGCAVGAVLVAGDSAVEGDEAVLLGDQRVRRALGLVVVLVDQAGHEDLVRAEAVRALRDVPVRVLPLGFARVDGRVVPAVEADGFADRLPDGEPGAAVRAVVADVDEREKPGVGLVDAVQSLVHGEPDVGDGTVRRRIAAVNGLVGFSYTLLVHVLLVVGTQMNV